MKSYMKWFKDILIVYKRILLNLDTKLEDTRCLIFLQSQQKHSLNKKKNPEIIRLKT